MLLPSTGKEATNINITRLCLSCKRDEQKLFNYKSVQSVALDFIVHLSVKKRTVKTPKFFAKTFWNW